MYITITMKIHNCKINIRVDKRQKIADVFAVLKNRQGLKNTPSPVFYKSLQNKSLVSSFNTFEYENIYSGDILEAIL